MTGSSNEKHGNNPSTIPRIFVEYATRLQAICILVLAGALVSANHLIHALNDQVQRDAAQFQRLDIQIQELRRDKCAEMSQSYPQVYKTETLTRWQGCFYSRFH